MRRVAPSRRAPLPARVSPELAGSGAPNRQKLTLTPKFQRWSRVPVSVTVLARALPRSLVLSPLTLVPQTRALLQPVVLCGSICCACARFQLRALRRMKMRGRRCGGRKRRRRRGGGGEGAERAHRMGRRAGSKPIPVAPSRSQWLPVGELQPKRRRYWLP